MSGSGTESDSGAPQDVHKRSEVAKHKTNQSAWLVIHNKVFDVTRFLDEHPGGCEVLMENAGKDGTENFEDIGHSTDARQMRMQYCIGRVPKDEEQKYSTDRQDWADEPKQPEGGFVQQFMVPITIAVCVMILMFILYLY